MKNRRIKWLSLIVLVAATMFNLLMGINGGLRRNWLVMGIYFFLTALFVLFCTAALLAMKIEACFKHLESLFPEKSNSVRPISSTINHNGIRKVSKLNGKIMFLIVISALIYSLLWFIAMFQLKWFWMGVIPLIWISNVVVCFGVLIALKLDTCSKPLERLISKLNNEI